MAGFEGSDWDSSVSFEDYCLALDFAGTINVVYQNMEASFTGCSESGTVTHSFSEEATATCLTALTATGKVEVFLPVSETLIRSMTNYGKKKLLDICFRNGTAPTSFKLMLCADNDAGDFQPTPDTETPTTLKEINAGNGYVAGGSSITRNSTGFPTLGYDLSADFGYISLKNVTFTASGGSIPASGRPIRYAVLLDQSSHALAYCEVSATGLTIPNGQTFVIQNFRLEIW